MAGRPGPRRAEEGRAAKTESERQKEGDLGTGNRHHRVPAEEPREPDVRTMNDTKEKKKKAFPSRAIAREGEGN